MHTFYIRFSSLSAFGLLALNLLMLSGCGLENKIYSHSGEKLLDSSSGSSQTETSSNSNSTTSQSSGTANRVSTSGHTTAISPSGGSQGNSNPSLQRPPPVITDSNCSGTKQYVCHLQSHSPLTLCISLNAVSAHLDHGDQVGKCQ